MAVPSEFFLSRFSDIVAFKQNNAVQQIGKFSDPPRREDLDRLTFETSELDSLRHCRVGDCGIHLSRGQIERLGAIDWSKADARSVANALLRQMLFEYAYAYRMGGNLALLEYRDAGDSIKVWEEVRSLVTNSNSDEFIYWSKEQFGLKPVVSMTHAVVYRPAGRTPAVFLIASKQIYASRYFSGSLALTFGVSDQAPAPGVPDFYLFYCNRSRPTTLPVLFGRLVRHFAQVQARSGMEENLHAIRDRIEAEYRAR